MSGPSDHDGGRTLTPAVVASALFVAACAVFAVTFVGTRGGIELPVAGRQSPAADGEPTAAPPTGTGEAPGPGATSRTTAAAPTAVPASAGPPSPGPTPRPTPVGTPSATAAPPPGPGTRPTFAPPTLAPNDPLLALPGCIDRPGCFAYIVARGDTLSGIISRYLLDIDVLTALNPELEDPSIIVVGQTLYLGRDPMARLEPCPDDEPCAVYVVIAGDTVNALAARYALTREAILAANPELVRPLAAGQVLLLPRG